MCVFLCFGCPSTTVVTDRWHSLRATTVLSERIEDTGQMCLVCVCVCVCLVSACTLWLSHIADTWWVTPSTLLQLLCLYFYSSLTIIRNTFFTLTFTENHRDHDVPSSSLLHPVTALNQLVHKTCGKNLQPLNWRRRLWRGYFTSVPHIFWCTSFITERMWDLKIWNKSCSQKINEAQEIPWRRTKGGN